MKRVRWEAGWMDKQSCVQDHRMEMEMHDVPTQQGQRTKAARARSMASIDKSVRGPQACSAMPRWNAVQGLPSCCSRKKSCTVPSRHATRPPSPAAHTRSLAMAMWVGEASRSRTRILGFRSASGKPTWPVLFVWRWCLCKGGLRGGTAGNRRGVVCLCVVSFRNGFLPTRSRIR